MKNRRSDLICVVATLLAASTAWAQGQAGSGAGQAPLEVLLAGNQRYVQSTPAHPHQDAGRRAEIARAQHPVAAILSCSDSRVAPEVLFDQGLGDVFVVRSAGNLADDVGVGSLEYAAEHLGVHLIVVLGHTRCGAVDAAAKGGEAPGHIGKLVEMIRPAVEQAKTQKGDLIGNAVRLNVEQVVAKLKSSHPLLSHLVEQGKLQIVGARYDLDSGLVEVLLP